MAQSKCSCGEMNFEIKELKVIVPYEGQTRVKYMAIQCSACGIVVGTHEGYYLSSVLAQIAQKLGVSL